MLVHSPVEELESFVWIAGSGPRDGSVIWDALVRKPSEPHGVTPTALPDTCLRWITARNIRAHAMHDFSAQQLARHESRAADAPPLPPNPPASPPRPAPLTPSSDSSVPPAQPITSRALFAPRRPPPLTPALGVWTKPPTRRAHLLHHTARTGLLSLVFVVTPHTAPEELGDLLSSRGAGRRRGDGRDGFVGHVAPADDLEDGVDQVQGAVAPLRRPMPSRGGGEGMRRGTEAQLSRAHLPEGPRPGGWRGHILPGSIDRRPPAKRRVRREGGSSPRGERASDRWLFAPRSEGARDTLSFARADASTLP